MDIDSFILFANREWFAAERAAAFAERILPAL
jgi:hypothetical protein